MPFYRKTIEQAVIYENKIVVDIYTKFNSMIFYNNEVFEFAIGEENYQYLMEYFAKEITMERVNSIFHEVKLLVLDILGSELVNIFAEEMQR